MAEEKQIKNGSIEDLRFDDKNFNRHTEFGMATLEKSVRRHKFGRSILVDKNNRIIAGNGIVETANNIGEQKTIVIETQGDELVVVKRTDVDLDTKAGREMALADNATASVDLEWDTDQLQAAADEWGISTDEWGVRVWDVDVSNEPSESEEEAIERKKKEFEERMAAGELSEDDPEYQEFLEKFKLKKTTDDCYTPDVVYDAVANWVAEQYGVSRKNFKRPFYPNGDYQKEIYTKSDVVVDNPPFSIMAEILKFYSEKGVRFFLFAPHLTLFSSSSSCCTALPTGVTVTYDNGANINTSFLTNLENPKYRVRSVPSLYKVIKDANDINLRQIRRQLPKYSYDPHIITSPFIGSLSRLGIAFDVPVAESEPISQLDSQRESGKAIYGKGYIVSDRVCSLRKNAEQQKAEREKQERETNMIPEHWELSENEKAIIKKLNNAANV